MLKELSSIQAYLPFIHAMLADPDFRDPMLATPAQLHQHLLDAHEDPAKRLFGTFDGGTLTGLFSVLVLPEEGYLQLLAGLSRQAAAYDALLSHLQAAYPGYQADFVYSPQGRLLHTALADRHAAFDPEQQKMVLRSPPRMCRTAACSSIRPPSARNIWRCTMTTVTGRANGCWPRRTRSACCWRSRTARSQAIST